MPSLIALVTRLSKPAEEAWLTSLRAAMPAETILPIGDMSGAELERAEIAIVANPDPADLNRLPNLKWVQSLWAGVERLVLELEGFAPPIVRLIDPRLAETMAEAVLAWTLYLSRDMPAYGAQQRDRVWKQLPYRAARDTRVGLLGLGELGSAAAEKLLLAGFDVAGWSRTARELPEIRTFSGAQGLDEMLSQSDILVCLLPLTAETTGLLGTRQFERLPEGAGFINFARGKIVRTDDLMAALDKGRLKHAVLDVFETEPLEEGSPLWSHPGITVLPHISAPTNQSTAAKIAAANIAAFRASGMLPDGIDFARGY
ncbi:glyoxylate/hydroxypyruvate reductase A [Rhizobium sp. S152]|uniref:2-hydroxyacid dehydrogenase n=1 Tax=Rhizobium sp. S152 TaxID=3055038 RepID=UPI0025A9D264|nr:glyoxylate/hydroxypyruvate reductase A [Rhizobium sp. S152]MDM9625506.1 glyoxylate/hydroxypyruvate reductase A [Rhizobium sp. S152]